MNEYAIAAVAVWAGGVAVAAAPAPIGDQAASPDMATLQSRVAELESRLAHVENGESWLTDQRASEIRSIVQDVLADADSRAALQGSGMTAGWDKGFFLASADGNFKLKIGGVFQIRYVYNMTDGILSQGGQTWNGLRGIADSNFGNLAFFNPDLTVVGLGGGLSDLVATGGGSRLALYNDAGLMYALGFSEAARQALIAPFVADTDPITPGVQIALSPGQIGDLDRTTALFIHEQIAGMSPAQRDAFAFALGRTITSPDGVGPVAVPGFTTVNGQPILLNNFGEYSSFLSSLYELNLRASSNGDSNRDGFELRRTQINFGGHVVNPQWQYYVMMEGSRSGGAFTVRDAWIKYDIGDGWSVKAGQYKAPFMREELTSDSKLQAVERSLINSMFTQSRHQGIQVEYNGDQLHGMAMISDGGNNAVAGQSSINVPWETEQMEGLALTARLEWLAMGDWKQFEDHSSFRGEAIGVMLGAAVHYDKEEFGTGALAPGSAFRPRTTAGFNNGEIETFSVTADASVDFGGASLYGAFVYRRLETEGPFIKQIVNGRNTFDQDQWGFQVQGGVFVTSDWELFARYEWADGDFPDIETGGVSLYSFDDLSLLTVGAIKYFSKHQIKWTTDFGVAFDRVEFFAADNGAGWRNQTGGEDETQFVIRSQLQLNF